MIIVAEGPSAAGKTTWVQQLNSTVVPEATVIDAAPDREAEPELAERYWAEKNSERWLEAVRLESTNSTVFCDTDPFKLHYVWSLWQIGEASQYSWINAVKLHRELFATGALGLADYVFVSIPSLDVLRIQKESDSIRTRRHFELHSKLGGPLRHWYEAIDALDPGRVFWEFVNRERILPEVFTSGRRENRNSLDLFDALIEKVSITPGA